MADQIDEQDDGFNIIPDEAPVKFDSVEHADIPQECLLWFTEDGTKGVNGNAEEGTLLQVKDVKLTFAKVIALAGDFYTNEPFNEAIYFPKEFSERVKRVIRGVNSMREDKKGNLPWLNKYLSDEGTGIEKVLSDIPEKEVEMVKDTPDSVARGVKAEDRGSHRIVQQYVNKTSKLKSGDRRARFKSLLLSRTCLT